MRSARRRDGRPAAALELRLDPDHPTPLYHQIVQGIRWHLGRGSLPPGSLLPPLREAARHWSVSYHTVRRAYLELAREGLVSPGRGDGTRVLQGAADGDTADAAEALDRFLERTVWEARRRFDLDPGELARALAGLEARAGEGATHVTVVECNDHQCLDLARQIASRWKLEARPWNLARAGEPEPGPLVGTWFHYAEMRLRWPHRVADMHFAALTVDSRLREELTRRLAGAEERAVTLCERDIGTAQQHAADVVTALPFPVEMTLATELPTPAAVRSSGGQFLIAPRLWDELAPSLHEHPRVLEIRHVFEEADLARIVGALGAVPAV